MPFTSAQTDAMTPPRLPRAQSGLFGQAIDPPKLTAKQLAVIDAAVDRKLASMSDIDIAELYDSITASDPAYVRARRSTRDPRNSARLYAYLREQYITGEADARSLDAGTDASDHVQAAESAGADRASA